jgi:uncharacterized protein (TIGR02265 family)
MESPRQIACSLTSTLLRRVERVGGNVAVERVLKAASSPYSAGYLRDVSNWVSYAEASALFAAAVEVTGDEGLPRRAGEDTVRQHAGTPVASLLRSMGSPEAILEQMSIAVTKFSMVTEIEAVEVGPGRAILHARGRDGFKRDKYLCEWTQGVLSHPTMLFGLPPGTVVETECQARGGSKCVYEVRWDAADAAGAIDPEHHITSLETQLAAMAERVESVLATAGDLIANDDVDAALVRIIERAATTVRAPRYLLAVRPAEGGELHCHHLGLTAEAAADVAARLERTDAPAPDGWLVAEVRSSVRAYGWLVAINDQASGFFPQERQLFGVYARFAASVLDRATALAEVQHHHDEAHAMLGLSRTLAAAGGTEDVVAGIVGTVPTVVDCDRVGLFLWDEQAGELYAPPGNDERVLARRVRPSDSASVAAMIASAEPEPLFYDTTTDDPFLARLLEAFGESATLVMPVAARGEFLGVLTVSAIDRPERVRPRPQLLDLLAGVVAQAATALQRGQLMDRITYQSLHDGLTGLANRELFGRRLEEAVAVAEADQAMVALFYADVDSFKLVNDIHGHLAGDALLRQVADRLARSVRRQDTVARLGGDEFAVLLGGDPSQAEIEAVARRVAAVFETDFVVEGLPLNMSASVGRAVWPADGAELDGLLRSADTDMYRVKRGRAAFAPLS